MKYLLWILLLMIVIVFSWGIWWMTDTEDILHEKKGLHPKVEQAMKQLIQKSKQKKIDVRIVQGYRSIERQNELYQQGRTKPGRIVTKAQGGESYHNYGLAIDFALYDPKLKRISWDESKDRNQNGQADWGEVVEIAKELGFAWGGDWKNFKDPPHLEMTFQQSIWKLKLKQLFK